MILAQYIGNIKKRATTMNFKEAFNELTKGKAIRLSCGTVEYPPLMDVCFLLENHNKIIDSNGYDVTFNILQCSIDDTLEWEIYEPTKEELLFEIIELKSSSMYHEKKYLKTDFAYKSGLLRKPSRM